MHKLLFTIASEPDPTKGKEPKELLKFTIKPFELFAKGIKFGREIDLYEQSGKGLVLHNPNNRECKFRVEVIPFYSAPVVGLRGYELPPKNTWLTVGDREFTLGPKEKKRIKAVIKIPRARNYRKKNYYNTRKDNRI